MLLAIGAESMEALLSDIPLRLRIQ